MCTVNLCRLVATPHTVNVMFVFCYAIVVRSLFIFIAPRSDGGVTEVDI